MKKKNRDRNLLNGLREIALCPFGCGEEEGHHQHYLTCTNHEIKHTTTPTPTGPSKETGQTRNVQRAYMHSHQRS